MKKVTYTIDEYEYFRMFYELDDEALKSLFEYTPPPLRCKYTLIEDNNEERYLLTDPDGNAMNINDLNGYQRGVVLSECYNHFHGMPFGDDEMPTGCIQIEDGKESLIRTDCSKKDEFCVTPKYIVSIDDILKLFGVEG